jgi:hypothetical protein
MSASAVPLMAAAAELRWSVRVAEFANTAVCRLADPRISDVVRRAAPQLLVRQKHLRRAAPRTTRRA